MKPQVEGNPISGDVSGFNAHARMMQIVQEMKEVQEVITPEQAKDASFIERIDAPDEGGILTYMNGHEEPYRGFPFYEMVDKIDILKKVVRATLSSFFHSIKRRNKLIVLTLAFVPWLLNDMARAMIHVFYRAIERHKIKPKYYSKSMRELYRAFTVFADTEVDREVRDFVCMILEMDNAYRFRFQDVIVELDKQALKKNTGKELTRLLSILQTRESGQTVRDTWTLFKTFIPTALWLSPKVKKQIVSVLTELNLSEVALTAEDKWYATPRKDYSCKFRDFPTEEDKALLERVQKNLAKKDAMQAVRDESTKAHTELFNRQAQELNISPEQDAQIVKEVEQLTVILSEEYNKRFMQAKEEVLRRHLKPEQLAVIEKQIRERLEMDNTYNALLKEAEK